MASASVLVINAGSSSLKLRLLAEDDAAVASRDVDAADDWESSLEQMLEDVPSPDAAGHRVVHGGGEFVAPRLSTPSWSGALETWRSWHHCITRPRSG